MQYKEQLTECIRNDMNLDDIVRRFFIVHPTFAFNDLVKADDILNRVSLKFDIPINDILVCGSAKIGFSLKSGDPYKPGVSDLDLAVINNEIYCKMFNKVLSETRNYSRKDLFENEECLKRYQYGINLGMINYNFLPNIEMKKELTTFFDSLSINHRELFSSISCCFYMSESNFKQKQINGLHHWKIDNFIKE